MRPVKTTPKTDVNKFLKEVLSRGPTYALPSELPDSWLRKFGRDLLHNERIRLNGLEDDPSIDICGPVLAVFALLKHKSGTIFAHDSLEELSEALDHYKFAITEEILGRETGVFLRDFTIDNIFTGVIPHNKN